MRNGKIFDAALETPKAEKDFQGIVQYLEQKMGKKICGSIYLESR